MSFVGEGARTKKLCAALVALLTIASLLPIWMVEYPPLVDYPNHLARIYLLQQLTGSASHLQGLYSFEWLPYPNLTMDVLALGLTRLMPLEVAGKVVLSIYVVLLPLALIFFASSMDRERWWAGLLGFFMTYNFYFSYGFVNFSLGLALFFFVLGLWIRWRSAMTLKRFLVVLVLLELSYFTHLQGFLCLVLAIGVYELPSLKESRMRLRLIALYTIPGITLLWWLTANMVITGPINYRPTSQLFRWKVMTLFAPFWSSGYVLAWIILLAIVVFVMTGIRKPIWVDRRVGLVFAALFASYLLMPAGVLTGRNIDVRTLPFLVGLTAALFVRPRWPRAWAAGFALLWVVQFSLLVHHWQQKDAMLREQAEAFRVVPAGSKVLPIILVKEKRFDTPENQFYNYIVVKRGAFVPTLFTIPAQYALRTSVPKALHRRELRFWRMCESYDYYWTFGADPFLEEIERRGEKVYEKGSLRVYRNRTAGLLQDTVPAGGQRADRD